MIEERQIFNRIPKDKNNNYSREFVKKRLLWLSEKTKTNLDYIGQYTIESESVKGNIENFIGAIQVPVGIAGPIKVNGQNAMGEFYIPMATTEGTLVETYQSGIVALNNAGGVRTYLLKDSINISPAFIMRDCDCAIRFSMWVNKNFNIIKEKAEETTKHGKLLELKPYIVGRRVLLCFFYDTGDAMGLNMINIATSHACKYIISQNHEMIENFYLRSNFSSDKKPSFFNFLTNYGKEVIAEATISQKIIRRFFGTTPQAIYKYCHTGTIGAIQSGMIGANAHFANGLGALFTACGQDIAQIVNACIGISIPEILDNGDLYISMRMPNIVVGTTGGGTKINTQKECLEIMGCYGQGKAKKFAEITAAYLLAGELAIYAALTTGKFIEAHIMNRKLNKK